MTDDRIPALLAAALGVPFTDGNRIDVLCNGAEIFPAMLSEIRTATTSVDFLTFVYWKGQVARQFADELSEAAKRGVRVRVLLDGLGALPMEADLLEQMRDAGVLTAWFHPVERWTWPWHMARRTHRKILVTDGRVGFTGGVGIGEEWEGDAESPASWRDTHFRLSGPAVGPLHAAFFEDWLEAVDEPTSPAGALSPVAHERSGDLAVQVIRSTGGVDWSNQATLVWTLVGSARTSIRVSTPYFVPTAATTQQLVATKARGVEVTILVPGPYSDERVSQVAGEADYQELLEARIEIFEYQRTMIHQKIMVIDHEIVLIGSGNLNQRSRVQDHEIQLVVSDQGFAAQIEEMLDEDFAQATAVELSTWKRRGPLKRLAEALMRPFRRQL